MVDPRGSRDRDADDASPGTALIAGLTTVWLVMLFVDPGPPLNLLELAYLLVIPGLALTRAAGLRTSPASVSIAVALSVGLVGLLQSALVIAEVANELVLRALIVIVVIGALIIDEYVAGSRWVVTLEDLASPDDDGASAHRS